MRYRFTRAWAYGVIAIGVAFIVAGAAAAALLLLTMPGELRRVVLEAVAAVLIGLGLGAPEIVLGQIVLVFLDQRRLLAIQARDLRRIADQLDAWGEGRGGQSTDAMERLAAEMRRRRS